MCVRGGDGGKNEERAECTLAGLSQRQSRLLQEAKQMVLSAA